MRMISKFDKICLDFKKKTLLRMGLTTYLYYALVKSKYQV